jgi:ATP-dependent Clp protease ATP-binding subunit ClpA
VPFINERIAQNQQLLDEQDRQRRDDKAGDLTRPSRFRFDPQAAVDLLKTRIVGQEQVLAAMEDMLLTVKADFNPSNRPLAVQLFMGPTGVGKTETVRVIAESIFGSPDKICRIDMNTLAQEHYSAALTGSPPGYVGSKEGQTLFDTEAIKGSFSEPGIVLFDEIEKANKDVVRALLNVLDTGKLVLSSGVKELDFSNTLIFMTSNIGARDIAQHTAKHQHGWRKWLGISPKAEHTIVERALTDHFDPEFLNRIDRIIPFKRIDKNLLESLLEIEIEKLNQRLSRRSASIVLDPSASTFLCSQHDERYGARNLARKIRVELEPKIAKALIQFPKQFSFTALVRGAELEIIPSES